MFVKALLLVVSTLSLFRAICRKCGQITIWSLLLVNLNSLIRYLILLFSNRIFIWIAVNFANLFQFNHAEHFPLSFLLLIRFLSCTFVILLPLSKIPSDNLRYLVFQSLAPNVSLMFLAGFFEIIANIFGLHFLEDRLVLDLFFYNGEPNA